MPNNEIFTYDTTQLEKAANEIKESRNGVISQANSLVVKDDGTSATANIFAKRIAAIIDTIEFKRKEQIKGARSFISDVNDFWKVFRLPAETALTALKQKIADHRSRVMAERAAEEEQIQKEEERRRKIQEAHAEQGHKVSAPVEMERPSQPALANDITKTRKVWTFKITDETQIPREYLKVDQVAIRRAVNNGVREIAGVDVHQEEQILVR